MGNLKTIQCPNCGSKKVKYLDDNMFECLNCQTSFYVDTNQTSVNHKHTYTNRPNAAAPINFNPKRALWVFLGILVIGFALIIPILFFTTNNNSSKSFSTSENGKAKDYTFNLSSSVAFIDQSKNLKIFMIGSIRSSNYDDNKHKDKAYWAVYDAVKGSYDQIEPLEVTSTTAANYWHRTECFKFDDGNIYIVVSNNLLYKYDAVTKNIQFLNNDIIANVKEMQSGIAYMERSTHKYSAFEIKSNSGKEVMYYPISKVYYADNFRQTVEPRSYPNEKPTTFFFQTNNQPSYLVRYNAMYSMGYPFCFDPHIESVFDEDENFKSASFSSYWVTASHLIDMEVLNTDNKVYDMTVLDFRDGIVALGVKTNNVSSEKFKIQWQDYNGKLLWSAPSEVSYLYDFSGVISKNNGLLFGSRDEYFLYSNQGKLLKKLELDELSFDLD